MGEIGLIFVDTELPKEGKFVMGDEEIAVAGDKYSIKRYDYELNRWTGSPHITVTHWRQLHVKTNDFLNL